MTNFSSDETADPGLHHLGSLEKKRIGYNQTDNLCSIGEGGNGH